MNRIIACFALSLVFISAGSFAGTDYGCLKGCINGGASYTSCMPKCSYDGSSDPAVSAMQPHASFSCLKNCMDSGGNSATCMPQCTSVGAQAGSGSALPAAKASANAASPHNVFKAPTISNDLVLTSPRHATPPADIDYRCMALCTQGGLQYAFCSQRCAK